eukprot:16431931-Heterocapsa_arctica.AAC.1
MMSSNLDGAAYDVEPTWRRGGLGSPKVQMNFLELRLTQEDRKPGSGTGSSSAQPQWEANHDQKKGVRIGESRIPA